MKVDTNIKSGSLVGDAFAAASALGDQVSSFVNVAEQQAADLTLPLTNAMSSLKQGFSDLLGLS